ncbi:hypothetical protein WJX74_002391 [Apatococcus lobatus]|uniref:SET domain-containing protein n=1 Tax=Apatococcus lobatus TaxID=904363 RepID=A0AAW1RXC3_9CHLO
MAYEGLNTQRRLKEKNWDGGPIFECGQACSCDMQGCANRVTQQPIDVAMCIERTTKGWSAKACVLIQRGQFVAQYAGELITSAEAATRLAEIDAAPGPTCHALLAVREFLPSRQACLRLNIDATRIGNVARFFNHSCDGGNLELFVVRAHGAFVPHIALFARREILPGEELTFSYGPPSAGQTTPDNQTGSACTSKSARVSKMNLPRMHKNPQRCLCGTSACLGFMPNSPV